MLINMKPTIAQVQILFFSHCGKGKELQVCALVSGIEVLVCICVFFSYICVHFIFFFPFFRVCVSFITFFTLCLSFSHFVVVSFLLLSFLYFSLSFISCLSFCYHFAHFYLFCFLHFVSLFISLILRSIPLRFFPFTSRFTLWKVCKQVVFQDSCNSRKESTKEA